MFTSNHLLPPKSYPSIFSVMTQKVVKEQIEKQSFFQRLYDTLQNELPSEEYLFLTKYILEEKYSHKAEQIKKKSQQRRKSKMEYISALNSVSSDLFPSQGRLSRKKYKKSVKQDEIKESSSKKSKTIKHFTYHSNDESIDTSNKSNNKISKKFNKIKFQKRRSQQFEHQEDSIKLNSPLQSIKSVSRQYLNKNYSNEFIDTIFEPAPLTQIKEAVLRASNLKSSSHHQGKKKHNQTHSHNRLSRELQHIDEKENKYRKITSMNVAPLLRRKKSNIKIHMRKF